MQPPPRPSPDGPPPGGRPGGDWFLFALGLQGLAGVGENVLLALAAGRDDNTVARSGFVASIIGKDVGLD